MHPLERLGFVLSFSDGIQITERTGGDRADRDHPENGGESRPAARRTTAWFAVMSFLP